MMVLPEKFKFVKFDAANTLQKTSGYLIGWKNQHTVGMQKGHNKKVYPHLQLLQALKACHTVENWHRKAIILYRH